MVLTERIRELVILLHGGCVMIKTYSTTFILLSRIILH